MNYAKKLAVLMLVSVLGCWSSFCQVNDTSTLDRPCFDTVSTPALHDRGQEKYPQVRVINGDTVTLITMEQVKKINLTYIDLMECDTLRKVDQRLLNDCEGRIAIREKIMRQQEEIIRNNALIAVKLKEDLSTTLERADKAEKRSNKLKWQRNMVGIVGGIVAVYGIVVTLIK